MYVRRPWRQKGSKQRAFGIERDHPAPRQTIAARMTHAVPRILATRASGLVATQHIVGTRDEPLFKCAEIERLPVVITSVWDSWLFCERCPNSDVRALHYQVRQGRRNTLLPAN